MEVNKLKKLKLRKADVLSVLEETENEMLFYQLGKLTFKIQQLEKKLNLETKNIFED